MMYLLLILLLANYASNAQQPLLGSSIQPQTAQATPHSPQQVQGTQATVKMPSATMQPQSAPIGFQSPAQMPPSTMQTPQVQAPFQQPQLPAQPQFPLQQAKSVPERKMKSVPLPTAQPQQLPPPPAQKQSASVVQMVPVPSGYILNPLSKAEFDQLSVEKKNNSDALMAQGIRKAANASYAVLTVDNTTFKTQLEAYLATIKKILIEMVGVSDTFTMRQALLNFVGQKNQIGGSLEPFVQRLTMKAAETAFLNDMYKEFSVTLLDQFSDLVKTCFFFVKTFDDEAQVSTATILANLICSQRTGSASGVQPKSDNEVQALLQQLHDLMSKEDLHKVPLSHDYIVWLGLAINKLRVNPNFYKYNEPVTFLNMLSCKEKCDNNKKITVQEMKNGLKGLFFDEKKFQLSDEFIETMINDHYSRK